MNIGRKPYWMIDWGPLIDLMIIPVALIFFFGLYLYWKNLKKAHPSFDISWKAINCLLKKHQIYQLLKFGLLGLRVYREPITGLFHGMVFWGMLLLFLGTTCVFFNVFFGIPLMSGEFYKWFMAFVLDLAGLAVLVGVLFLLIRRLFHYPRLVVPKARSGMIAAELLLLSVIVSGFWVEALRISLATTHEIAFVGQLLADLMGPVQAFWPKVYPVFWWIHGLLALILIAYIPFSPLVHLLFVPFNALLAEPSVGAEEKQRIFR